PLKRLWTPSFGLLTGALVVVILLVGWLLHDAPSPGEALVPSRWAGLLVAYGRNPLLIYFGAHVALHELRQWGGDPGLLGRLLQVDWPWGGPTVTAAALFAGAWGGLAGILHRQGRYLRA